ncbi:MAG: DUF1467 family protein [Parvularculales bacterium]
MDLVLALVLFCITWSVIFFAVLPWGITTYGDAGSVETGMAESAPIRPRIGFKAVLTTIVTVFVWGILLAIIYWWPEIRDSVSFLANLERIWE